MDQPESTANTSRSMASAFTKGEVKNWANLKVKTKNKHPLTHSSKCSCKIKNNVALQWEVYHSQLKLEMPPTASSDDRRLMYINTHIKILKTMSLGTSNSRISSWRTAFILHLSKDGIIFSGFERLQTPRFIMIDNAADQHTEIKLLNDNLLQNMVFHTSLKNINYIFLLCSLCSSCFSY